MLQTFTSKSVYSKFYINDPSSVVQEGKYAIVTDRWQKFSDVYLNEKVLDFLSLYADEFLVHGVDVEGKK